MHAFEQQDCRLSLAEGLAEYHNANPGLLRGEDLSAQARQFFSCHDVVHVVFGCSTALPHEVVVKLSSIFGSTGGFGVLRGYRLHEAVDIYRRLDWREVLATMLRAVVIVPRTIVRCRRQHRRWPWAEFDAELQRPLQQLRADYGIVVAGPVSRWP